MSRRLDFTRDKGRSGWTDDNEPPFVRMPPPRALCLAHRAGKQPRKYDPQCFLCKRLYAIKATHRNALRAERLARSVEPIVRKPRPL